LPAGSRVYAVGDVHGRLDLLRRMLRLIVETDRGRPPAHRFLVFLGDYVDRGPESRGVVDTLLTDTPAGFRTVCLKGNHEAAMIGFLGDTRFGAQWLGGGALATFLSYGISPPHAPLPLRDRLHRLQTALRAALPDDHLAFLTNLPTRITIGDYLFVHAGVRPGVALGGQTEEDLIWIRDEFLTCPLPFAKVVVHGHTIRDAPELRSNRIGIDTGAFATNRLTCVLLEGSERVFLST